MGTLPDHKFVNHLAQGADYKGLSATDNRAALSYLVEVEVDGFISLEIPTLCEQLLHVTNVIMMGFHNEFVPDKIDENVRSL